MGFGTVLTVTAQRAQVKQSKGEAMNKVESTMADKAGLTVERGEYSGKPTMSIRRGAGDKFPFSFGLGKAKMIVAMIDEIRAFVDDCEKAAVTAAAPISPAPTTLSVDALRALLAQAEAKAQRDAKPAYGKRRVKNIAARAASI